MKTSLSLLTAAGSLLLACSSMTAATLVSPYTENFSSDNALWTQNSNAAATWVSSGGVGGVSDGYITTPYSVTNTTAGTPVVARATGSNNASGSQFVGDYSNITTISFSIKTDATFALPIALRLGSATPGWAITIDGGLLQPTSGWTTYTFALSATNPNIISYEGTSGATNADKFANAISNVANLQVFFYLGETGYSAPATTTPVTISVDSVSAVPEPSTYALMVIGLGVLVVLRSRNQAKLKAAGV